MTSMKIFRFSRPPTPLLIYLQNLFTPLTLDVQFQMIPPLQIIINQLKENIIQGWLLYVIRSFLQLAFVSSINSLILSGFLLTSFHLAEASRSPFSWLYGLVSANVQKYHEMNTYLYVYTFLVLILQSTCFTYTT